MNQIKLKVVSSNPTKNNNFCNKLQAKETVEIKTDFGTVSADRQVTYFLFTDKQNAKDMESSLDLDLFDLVLKPIWLIGEGDETVVAYAETDVPEGAIAEQVDLKYLYPKRP